MKWDKGLKVQRDGIWYQDPKVGYPCECVNVMQKMFI